jgi:hypothetical protein
MSYKYIAGSWTVGTTMADSRTEKGRDESVLGLAGL